MQRRSFGKSDIGLVRLNNEDIWAQIPELGCYLLADGMGGHNAGEVAASETVLFLSGALRKAFAHSPSGGEWTQIVDKAIREANEWVYRLSEEDPAKQGMGTTLCLLLFSGKEAICAHVGDSRIYRIRKGRILQLTRDHSLRHDLIEKGELDESLGSSFPFKNVITRAIGTQKAVEPEIDIETVEPGDLYLLCSDGLTDPMNEEQILSVIQRSETIKDAGDELITEAKERGSQDNITVLLVSLSYF